MATPVEEEIMGNIEMEEGGTMTSTPDDNNLQEEEAKQDDEILEEGNQENDGNYVTRRRAVKSASSGKRPVQYNRKAPITKGPKNPDEHLYEDLEHPDRFEGIDKLLWRQLEDTDGWSQAVLEIGDNEQLLYQVAQEMIKFKTAAGSQANNTKLRSLKHNLEKAIDAKNSGAPYEHMAGSKASYLALRYWDRPHSLNATIAGYLARLNLLHLAQVGDSNIVTARGSDVNTNSLYTKVSSDILELRRDLEKVTKRNANTLKESDLNDFAKEVSQKLEDFEKNLKKVVGNVIKHVTDNKFKELANRIEALERIPAPPALPAPVVAPAVTPAKHRTAHDEDDNEKASSSKRTRWLKR